MRNALHVRIVCAFLVSAVTAAASPPNVVLIMADDIGWEGFSCYGSQSYRTPNIDRMAAEGLRFTHCYAQPKCTPSRVQIMTGKYNFRNYRKFGVLDSRERTFGHLLQAAGYKTCIAGKWQLNGGGNAVDRSDSRKPLRFGFDSSCLWQVTSKGDRYRDPELEIDGNRPRTFRGKYGPDLVNDHVCKFIRQNSTRPFFIYYPMILPHDPFLPTPDSEDWNRLPHKSSPQHFKDMVQYVDKLVGRVLACLRNEGLDENTLVLFTGDNGTSGKITSQTNQGPVRGAKGSTRDAGIHVPLVARWKTTGVNGVCDDLVDFTDFLPTVVAASGSTLPTGFLADGKSFLPQIKGEESDPRSFVYFHYYPRHGTVWKSRCRMVRTKQYKLYHDGRFFDVMSDPREKSRLRRGTMTENQQKVFAALTQIIEYYDEAGAAEDALLARQQWSKRLEAEAKRDSRVGQ